MPQGFLMILVKVATTFPRAFPGGLCRRSLHQLRVKLRAPLTGRRCRASLHEVQPKLQAPLTGRPCRGSPHGLPVKLRAPLTGRLCRGSLRELRVKLRALLTGGKKQRVGHMRNKKKRKNFKTKAPGSSELLGMWPTCYLTVHTAPHYHQDSISLGMCGHGYHTPQGKCPCGGPTYTKHKAKAKVQLPPINLSIQTPPVPTTCTQPETYRINLPRPN